MGKGRTLPVWVLLLLAGCHGDSSQAPQAAPVPHKKNPVAVKRGPTPEELTAGMVEAVPLGKSTLPLAIKFDLPARPTIGQPLEVVIAVMPQVSGSASIQVSSSDGLKLSPGAGTIDMASVDPTQAYRVSIATLPAAEGVQLLNLNVSLTHDDATETRSFAVPIIVGAAAGGAPVVDAAAGPGAGAGVAGAGVAGAGVAGAGAAGARPVASAADPVAIGKR